MEFSLLGTSFYEVDFNSSSLKAMVTDEVKTDIGYAAKSSTDNPKNFGIYFEIEITHPDSELDFHFKMKSISHFICKEDEVTEEFLKGPFAQINAPAIAYPYIRAFISNFFLSAGYQPVILPTLNFVKTSQAGSQGQNSK